MFHHTITLTSPRSKSDDRAVVLPLDKGGIVVVVADGAGGLSGGGRAADLVVERVEGAVRGGGLEPENGQGFVDLLLDLDHQVERDAEAGETTAVVLVITASGVVGASCGDSEASLVTSTYYDVLTTDQHRKRRIGSSRALPVAFERDGLGKGVLVIGTDGLFAFARPEAVCATVRAVAFDEVGPGLVRLVRSRAGNLADDVAVVVVKRADP